MAHQNPAHSVIPSTLRVVACLTLGALTTIGCDTKSKAEEAADEAADYRELKQNMEDDAPDSPQEMKEEVGVKSMDEERPQSAEELREELDLHPERTPDDVRE